MKGKKFYLILTGLVIIGIVSIFFYQRQQEARFLAFEGYEISEIEARVAGLYNKDQTDIIDEISEKELDEIDEIFLDLKDEDFGRQNERRLKDAEVHFLMAKEMNTIESEIATIFLEGDIIDHEVSMEEVNHLEQEVEVYETKPVYYERNIEILADAKTQITDIETATEFVENLFDDEEEEDTVHADVTREDEEEARELIDLIRNEEVKEQLTSRVEVVNLALTEMEEALALEEEPEVLEEEALEESEEELLEEDELELEEEEPETEYAAPANDWNAGSSESTWTPPARSNSGSNNSSDSTWQPTPSPEPEPEQESEPQPQPEPEPEPEQETEDSTNEEENPEDSDNSDEPVNPEPPVSPETPEEPTNPETP